MDSEFNPTNPQRPNTDGTPPTPRPIQPTSPAPEPTEETAAPAATFESIPVTSEPEPDTTPEPTPEPVTEPTPAPTPEAPAVEPIEDKVVTPEEPNTDPALAPTPASVVAPSTGPAVIGDQVTAAAAIVGTPDGPTPVTPPKRSRRKLFTIIGVTVGILVIAAGVVFGLYLPNTPDNAYKTGMNRSGQALEEVINTATSAEQLEAYKQSEFTGSVEVKHGKETYSAAVSSKFDASNSDNSLDVSMPKEGGADQKLSAKLLTAIAKGKTYPDIYFQLNGLKQLGVDAFMPELSKYDGKWISVEASYIESLVSSTTGEEIKEDAAKSITSADITEMSKAVMAPTREYVFTADSDKAVLKKKSFVGKEKADDMTLYRYKVALDVANLKDYCVALSDSVLSTKVYKKFVEKTDAEITKEKQDAAKECKEDDGYKDATKYGYDLWIDGKYKLIHKIRVTDFENKSNYVEVGQVYKGGDDLELFVQGTDADSKSEYKVTLTTNLKDVDTRLSVTAKIGEGEDAYNITGNFAAKALKSPVKVTPPAGAIPIKTILDSMGFGEDAFTSPTSSDTDDQDLTADELDALDDLEGFDTGPESGTSNRVRSNDVGSSI